jgi:hypothetical protein
MELVRSFHLKTVVPVCRVSGKTGIQYFVWFAAETYMQS